MTAEERKELIKEIVSAIQPMEHVLTPEEAQWVKMAIHREAQSIELRKAIIEKTLTGLLWSMIAGVGIVVMEYIKNHFGYRP